MTATSASNLGERQLLSFVASLPANSLNTYSGHDFGGAPLYELFARVLA